MKRTFLQLAAELRIILRNGEQLLLTLIIPAILLGFFGSVDILPSGEDDPLSFLVPGVYAVAIMSSAMVSMGIATGFERSYLVLKRLGATPLTRAELVVAKVLSIFVVEILQAVVLFSLGFTLGWRPDGNVWPLAFVTVLLGTTAFGGVGLILAGRLRAEINLAAQNGIYLLLLLLGGMIIPRDSLPGVLGSIALGLPSTALADGLRASLNGTGELLQPFLILSAWAVLAPVIAARRFRWS